MFKLIATYGRGIGKVRGCITRTWQLNQVLSHLTETAVAADAAAVNFTRTVCIREHWHSHSFSSVGNKGRRRTVT